MKLDDILILEYDSFDDAKERSGYHQEFPSVEGIWADTVLRLLRVEQPYKDNPSARSFSTKVENFFNSKFGNMVYHKGDQNIIDQTTDSVMNTLEADSSVENVKQTIRKLTMALNRLVKDHVIAPAGAHNYETDFWMDQREKNDYMRGRI